MTNVSKSSKPRNPLRPLKDYFDRKLWHKTKSRKKNAPMLGALSVIGKDQRGRSIIVPTGFLEQTGRRPTVEVARSVTADFMEVVNEKLAPYKFKGSPIQ